MTTLSEYKARICDQVLKEVESKECSENGWRGYVASVTVDPTEEDERTAEPEYWVNGEDAVEPFDMMADNMADDDKIIYPDEERDLGFVSGVDGLHPIFSEEEDLRKSFFFKAIAHIRFESKRIMSFVPLVESLVELDKLQNALLDLEMTGYAWVFDAEACEEIEVKPEEYPADYWAWKLQARRDEIKYAAKIKAEREKREAIVLAKHVVKVAFPIFMRHPDGARGVADSDYRLKELKARGFVEVPTKPAAQSELRAA